MLKLSDKQLRLLRECLVQHCPDLLKVVDSDELISVDEELGNELRDAITDEFMCSSLRQDYEPNTLGLKLEKTNRR